jgi:microcystin degradation protein MlrC
VVLSDQGDNPGAGAPGDSTVLFEALERRQVAGALVASLCAPEAVTACHDAGVGAGVSVRLGSSTVDVTVEAVTDGRYVINSPTHPNVPFNIGPAALVRSPGGVGIVLTSTPVQNEDLQLFDLFGLDITQPPIVAVKSNAHFRAAFEPIATAVIDVDTPGIATPHLARLPYRHVRRPIWPLDPNLEWQPA